MSPFAKIVVPAVVGIVAAHAIAIPWGVAVGGALTISCSAAAAALVPGGSRVPWMSSLYVWLAIASCFFAMATVRMPRGEVALGEHIEMAARIVEHPSTRGRWQSTTAVVGRWRPASLPAAAHDTLREADGSIKWHRVRERILLNVDTCHGVAAGDRLILRGYLNPLTRSGDESGYTRLMALRGIFGRTYLTPGNLIAHSSGHAAPAARLQGAAVERLARLRLDSAQMAVVTAMAAGWRGNIDRGLRNAYSATGASHLLAVSGLHVGIVFVVVNALIFGLLWLLAHALPRPEWLLRHSLIIRCTLAVAAIWLYAAAAGLAPSVVRAALMFSLAQWALAGGARRDALNTLLGAAVVMLAVNPNWWGDAGFMLSFAAVLSIILFFRPLYRLLRTPWRVVNALVSVLVVGLAASVGTAPLVAYYFGSVPLVGLLINPAVVLTAHIIVAFGVLWMVCPVWPEGFSAVLGWAAGTQNSIVEWSAARPWAALDVGSVPLWAVVAAYALLGMLALILNRK